MVSANEQLAVVEKKVDDLRVKFDGLQSEFNDFKKKHEEQEPPDAASETGAVISQRRLMTIQLRQLQRRMILILLTM